MGGANSPYSSVSEPPRNRRILHACHRLYHVPFIPRRRRRVSTSGCCVLHHRVLTFPHISPSHLIFTRVSRCCVCVTITVSFRSLFFLSFRETTFFFIHTCDSNIDPASTSFFRCAPHPCYHLCQPDNVYPSSAPSHQLSFPFYFHVAYAHRHSHTIPPLPFRHCRGCRCCRRLRRYIGCRRCRQLRCRGGCRCCRRLRRCIGCRAPPRRHLAALENLSKK